MKLNIYLLLPLILTANCFCQNSFNSPQPYAGNAKKLKPTARISFEKIDESSAIEKSSVFEDVYWTLNDSGDKSRIFAINGNGEIIKPDWADKKYSGITIGHAINIDWEDIAADNSGNLYIAAFGNNANVRRDLSIYVIPEPNPYHFARTRPLRTINFKYPDQHDFPPELRNFDSEALVWSDGKLYLLTKHRSDTFTKLYQVPDYVPGVSNDLIYLDNYDVGGMVTAADVSDDGQTLAVLTYNDVWLFSWKEDSKKPLHVSKYRYPIIAQQCEGICFDGSNLRITNEQREIFIIPLAAIQQSNFKY